MNTLLLFFALPVATIILAIVLEKILDCPILVAATFFAIFLIVTFAAFDSNFLVFAIVYTILAFITASLVKAICNFIRKCLNNQNNCLNNNSNNNQNNNYNNNLSSNSNNTCICGENSDTDDNNDSCPICSRGDFYPTQNYTRRFRR